MNGTDLLRAMSYVDEEYLCDAEEEREKGRAPMLLRWGALAACAALAVTGALLLRQPAPVEPQPEVPTPRLTDPVPVRTPPVEVTAAPRLTIDLDGLVVNELDGDRPQAALSARFYLEHEQAEWSEEETAAWFGRTDFAPAFIPNGLTLSQGGGRAMVWTDRENGEVVIDLLRFSAEDGDDARLFPRSFVLTVSKHDPRPFRDWLHWGETLETCQIAGVEATIVHAVYSHGPYDPETHEPAGYYDWYDVDFALDGLNYALTAQRLDLEEVAAVAASVITGGVDFTVTGGVAEGQ